jgi:uncharacterized membrane protein
MTTPDLATNAKIPHKTNHNSHSAKIRRLIVTSLMTAFVFAGTRWLQIPNPTGTGYIHAGDVGIFLTALLFGPIPALFAGSVGGALSDLTTSPHWIVPTLLIKGSAGWLVGWSYQITQTRLSKQLARVIPIILGCVVILIGYFMAGRVLYGNWVVPASSLLPNLVQVVFGMVMALLLLPKLQPFTKNL